MKFKFFLPIILAVVMVGCSEEDDDPTPTPPENNFNYFPLAVGNSWTYNNERQIQGQAATQSTETMMVIDSTEENGSVHYDLESDNALEGGVATSLFSNGKLTKSGSELLYTGTFKFFVGMMGIDSLVFPISNAVVFSTTASAGTELYVFSDGFSQQVPIQGVMVPIKIEYTAKTNSLGVLDSRTVDGQEFEDVLSSNVVMTVKITATISTPFGDLDVPIMAEQEVATATNYYANNVGMVESDVSITYELEDLTEFGFPSIPPVDIQSTQEIESYTVVE